jgi:hypothetical protein
MDFRLYIIGTSHPIQCASRGCANSQVAAFDAEVRRACSAHSIARVVEEMSRAGLAHYEVECTVAARVAKELGIEHGIVDLEPEERNSLSLDDGVMLNVVLNRDDRYSSDDNAFRDAFDALWNAVRERVWIGRMLTSKTWPALFICGSDHTDAIESLWKSLGLPVVVIHKDFEPQ